MEKKVAVVILNWNGADMLRQYLPTVLEYSRDEAEVYVADNASTDESIELLKTTFPEVKLIVLERNWGFADGYNKALAQIDNLGRLREDWSIRDNPVLQVQASDPFIIIRG